MKADALQGVENGLIGILDGTKSVAQGFKEMADKIIADLARIAIEKLILSVIGLKEGGRVAGFASGGLPGFASGGLPSVSNGIINGPGTGTSDSILAAVRGKGLIKVSRGEAIVNERGVQKHWPLIDAINHDRLPAFASGGMIDASQVYMRTLPSAASLARPSAGTREVMYVQVDKSDLFDVHVQRAAAPLAQAAMVGGSAMAQQEFADDRSRQIP